MMKFLLSFAIALVGVSTVAAQATVELRPVVQGAEQSEKIGDLVFLPPGGCLSQSDSILIQCDPQWDFQLIWVKSGGKRIEPQVLTSENRGTADKPRPAYITAACLTTVGEYTVDITLFDAELGIYRNEFVLTIGQTPTPDPEPDDPPKPDPDNPPLIKVEGLTIGVVYDARNLQVLKPAQREILYSPAVRQWLNAHCHKVDNLPQWRFIEDTARPTGVWGEILASPRTSTPWIIIVSPSCWYSGPAPETVDEALRLLGEHLE